MADDSVVEINTDAILVAVFISAILFGPQELISGGCILNSIPEPRSISDLICLFLRGYGVVYEQGRGCIKNLTTTTLETLLAELSLKDFK